MIFTNQPNHFLPFSCRSIFNFPNSVIRSKWLKSPRYTFFKQSNCICMGISVCIKLVIEKGCFKIYFLLIHNSNHTHRRSLAFCRKAITVTDDNCLF